MAKAQSIEKNQRREFIKKTTLGLGILPFAHPLIHTVWPADPGSLNVHIFSKHLQFLDWAGAGEKAAELGFAGLDLTVRPGGHVEPVKVAAQLPQALEDIKKGGSSCSIITTAVESIHNRLDLSVLETAAAHGVHFYRTNWYRYQEKMDMQDSLKHYQKEIKRLSRTNEKLGMVGCYQNHAGELIGSSLWELKQLLEKSRKAFFGVQYDIRHATVEGGLSWSNGMRLIHEHIKTIVLKDFKWEKINGSWQTVNTPIGEGQVDFHSFFRQLKNYGIQVPAILHLEYALGGAEHGHSRLTIDPSRVFDAMRNDLNRVQHLWESA